MGYYIGKSKNRVSAKFLNTLYIIKSVYIEFLELIKNRVPAKSLLKEAMYNEALLYLKINFWQILVKFSNCALPCGISRQMQEAPEAIQEEAMEATPQVALWKTLSNTRS